jgi:hypothetical protein
MVCTRRRLDQSMSGGGIKACGADAAGVFIGLPRASQARRGRRSNQSGSCASWLADMRLAQLLALPAQAAAQTAGYRPA